MLDPQTVARMRELLGGHRCECGRHADRFRSHGGKMEYFCHECFMERTEDPDDSPTIYKVHRQVFLEQDDADNVANLCWAPPLRPTRARRSKARA